MSVVIRDVVVGAVSATDLHDCVSVRPGGTSRSKFPTKGRWTKCRNGIAPCLWHRQTRHPCPAISRPTDIRVALPVNRSDAVYAPYAGSQHGLPGKLLAVRISTPDNWGQADVGTGS